MIQLLSRQGYHSQPKINSLESLTGLTPSLTKIEAVLTEMGTKTASFLPIAVRSSLLVGGIVLGMTKSSSAAETNSHKFILPTLGSLAFTALLEIAAALIIAKQTTHVRGIKRYAAMSAGLIVAAVSHWDAYSLRHGGIYTYAIIGVATAFGGCVYACVYNEAQKPKAVDTKTS